MTSSSRSLEGVRVLDLSRLLPAPFATMILADLGATVDKLEDPKGGDFARVTQPLADDGMGVMYHGVNRGKRSLVLDLKQEAGREAFLRILPKYDVLVESNRPGVMSRLGIGYETLKEAHPGLIYCAITGYGQDGPLKDRAGHDLNYIARAGVLGFTGPAGAPPTLPGGTMADISGGLYGVIGILAALQERARTGQGRMVDISMTEAAVGMATFGFGCHLGGFELPRGEGVLMGGFANYGTYTTKDGRSMALGALEPKFWMAFCAGVGLDDPMKALMPGADQSAWKAKVAEVFASKTRDEWVAFSQEVDCCLEPVLSPGEVLSDPHFEARGVFQERATSAGGKVVVAATPAAPPAEGVAPKQGEQSGEILGEMGFEEAEIAALREAGITR